MNTLTVIASTIVVSTEVPGSQKLVKLVLEIGSQCPFIKNHEVADGWTREEGEEKWEQTSVLLVHRAKLLFMDSCLSLPRVAFNPIKPPQNPISSARHPLMSPTSRSR